MLHYETDEEAVKLLKVTRIFKVFLICRKHSKFRQHSNVYCHIPTDR